MSQLTRVTSWLVQWQSKVTGAISRLLGDKLDEWVSIADFGADPTGATPANDAFAAALASNRVLLIPHGFNAFLNGTVSLPKGSHIIIEGKLTTSLDVTINSNLIIRGSGYIENTGNLTLLGDFKAPESKVFFGNGVIKGLRYAIPEWWGAVAYQSATADSTDSAPAINAAATCLGTSLTTRGKRPTLELLSGQYLIKRTVTLPVSANIGLKVIGQGKIFSGTRLVAHSTFTGTRAVSINGSTDGTQSIADFILLDFGIVPLVVGSGPKTLIGFGSAGNKLIGLAENMVSGLYLGAAERQIDIINARQIQFRDIGLWNNELLTAGTNIFIESREHFCGDLTFHNVQTVNSANVAGSVGVRFQADGVWSAQDPNSGYMIAGIRFTECILYPADVTVYGLANNGARVEDIFFTNCQLDGSTPCMFYFVSSGAGSRVRDIQITHNYLYGGNLDVNRAACQFIAQTGGVMGNIRIDSNTFGNAASRVVNFTTDAVDLINGISVSDNYIVDFNNPNNPAIEFGQGCHHVQANFNTADRLSGSNFFPYLIQFDNGVHHAIAMGNMGKGIVANGTVRDLMASTDKVIVNNL